VSAILVFTVETAEGLDMAKDLRTALTALNANKGDSQLCILTDASYVRLNGKTTEFYLDIIREETGCTIGQANLLLFHRPMSYPLKVAIFCRDTGQCMVLSYDQKEKASRTYNLALDAVTKPEFWIDLSPPLGTDTFTVISLAHAWAAGAPYDLPKSAEFHGHLCPAIVAGHVIGQFIINHYPLRKGQSYTWIASPPWCKEEAIQTLLHLTPGRKNLYAKDMTQTQKDQLTFQNPAGILLISGNDKTKAVVFSFDWDKVRKQDKLKMALGMIPYLERPEELVKGVKGVLVPLEVIEKLTTEETNPYQWLGLTR
jgi:formylmethanofuran dehydrogenase subunit E-like metal-binding protein